MTEGYRFSPAEIRITGLPLLHWVWYKTRVTVLLIVLFFTFILAVGFSADYEAHGDPGLLVMALIMHLVTLAGLYWVLHLLGQGDDKLSAIHWSVPQPVQSSSDAGGGAGLLVWLVIRLALYALVALFFIVLVAEFYFLEYRIGSGWWVPVATLESMMFLFVILGLIVQARRGRRFASNLFAFQWRIGYQTPWGYCPTNVWAHVKPAAVERVTGIPQPDRCLTFDPRFMDLERQLRTVYRRRERWWAWLWSLAALFILLNLML